jgi:hypothetical protein
MPIQHAVWTVADRPVEVPQGVLPSEQRLEDMIVDKCGVDHLLPFMN